MALTKSDLDIVVVRGCEAPGCDHHAHAGEPLYLVQQCCAGAGVDVSYASGVLILQCHNCEEPFLTVQLQDALH